jgi:hypothetical protein
MQRKVNKKKKTYINCSTINIAVSSHFLEIYNSSFSILAAENLAVLQISLLHIKVAGHLKQRPGKCKNFEWLPLPLEE